MDSHDRRRRARSFGSAAVLYDQIRPTYPAAAVQWALDPLGPGPHRVADIGAGTGLLTRVILALGQETMAVEPDDLMRARLAEATPMVQVFAGSAEQLPFPDGELAAAVAGQAYHWFDRSKAHEELARVIRSGGVFAAIWNERDQSVPWLAEYSRIVDGSKRGDTVDSARSLPESFGPHFEATERAEFRHSTLHTADSLVALMQSRSYYLTADPGKQAALATKVRELATSHPDLAGSEQFALSYITEVYRGVRR